MRTGFGGTGTDPVGGGDEMRPTAAATTEPAPVSMGGGTRLAQPGGEATTKTTTAPVSMGGGGGTAGTTFTGQGATGEEALGGGVQDPTPVDK